MKAVAASLEGRHRAPRGLTEPRGPTRGVGACARPIRCAQAVGPGPGVGPTACFAYRRDRGSRSPIRRGGTRTGAPGPVSPSGRGPPEEGPPGGAALRLSAGADPPFQGGGSTLLPVMAFVRTKVPLGRVPAGGPPGGESGHMPPASRPQVRGHAAGEYVAASLPLLG
jgi:hypothetical protein